MARLVNEREKTEYLYYFHSKVNKNLTHLRAPGHEYTPRSNLLTFGLHLYLIFGETSLICDNSVTTQNL